MDVMWMEEKLTATPFWEHPDVKGVLWESHDVAEYVGNRGRQEGACAEEQERTVEAKEARIRELEYCGAVWTVSDQAA